MAKVTMGYTMIPLFAKEIRKKFGTLYRYELTLAMSIV